MRDMTYTVLICVFAASTLTPNFRISADNSTLTLKRVCLNSAASDESVGCGSQLDSPSMVIQCNASNEHGHAFANGYINVLGW